MESYLYILFQFRLLNCTWAGPWALIYIANLNILFELHEYCWFKKIPTRWFRLINISFSFHVKYLELLSYSYWYISEFGSRNVFISILIRKHPTIKSLQNHRNVLKIILIWKFIVKIWWTGCNIFKYSRSSHYTSSHSTYTICSRYFLLHCFQMVQIVSLNTISHCTVSHFFQGRKVE